MTGSRQIRVSIDFEKELIRIKTQMSREKKRDISFNELSKKIRIVRK